MYISNDVILSCGFKDFKTLATETFHNQLPESVLSVNGCRWWVRNRALSLHV